MKCLRFGIRRNLSRYAHDELPPNSTRQLEDHLLDCAECRSTLTRIRQGNRLARQAPPALHKNDSWAAIEDAIVADTMTRDGASSVAESTYGRGTGLAGKSWLPAAAALAAVAVALAGAAVILVYAFGPSRPGPTLSIDVDAFHPVAIADMERSTKPHVVAEGYVSELRLNDEDGDLRFKLVEDLNSHEPFIVCEIIDPIKVEPPAVGSRVRVYGVSRFDNQENHLWYEVHPVLNIEVVRR